ncbi:unnamed protein product [Urochloa humidicola]
MRRRDAAVGSRRTPDVGRPGCRRREHDLVRARGSQAASAASRAWTGVARFVAAADLPPRPPHPRRVQLLCEGGRAEIQRRAAAMDDFNLAMVILAVVQDRRQGGEVLLAAVPSMDLAPAAARSLSSGLASQADDTGARQLRAARARASTSPWRELRQRRRWQLPRSGATRWDS